MSNEKPHIVSYKTHFLVLSALIVFTLLSVAITQIELSSYATIAALLIAGIKSTFILLIFMHLKYDLRMFKVMVGLIIGLLFTVIFITMLDYIFR